MVSVKLVGITKKYGDKIALDNVSFTVEDRSFTCILGPPGAGKTTLLRIVAGLESPDKGEIYFDDAPVRLETPKERGVGMVFQDFALYPHMTVFDNIANPLKTAKLSMSEVRRRVVDVAKFLKIDELLDRMPLQISGGEMQRVAIARAMVKGSKIYLLDEPLVNLDYRIREDMRGELKKMQEELEETILYATPDPVDALAMADKIAVMRDGRVEQFGETMDIYSHPRNVFVASYLGYLPMNMMECKINSGGRGLILDTGEFKVDASRLKDKIRKLDEAALLGIRPEHVQVTEEKPGEGDVKFESELIVGEVIGSDTILHFKVKDQIFKAFVPKMYPGRSGEKLWISFNLDDIRLFDRDTGESIMEA
jgi:multiple sugar transport system ATP-binding protein